MSRHVCNGATLSCTFGAAPATLAVLPARRVLTSSQPAATILDMQPLVNVQPFGLCMSPANPMVIAATTAALGVFTPQPCIPMTVAPWAPGVPDVLEGGTPVLDTSCVLTCLWGGVIQVAAPGQFTHEVP
jgi:hypothetical protein